MTLIPAVLLSMSLSAPIPKLPAELAIIPADAAGFATLKFNSILKTDCFKSARIIGNGITWDQMPIFSEEMLGVFLERATVIWPVPNPHPEFSISVVPNDVLGPIHVLTFERDLPPPFAKGSLKNVFAKSNSQFRERTFAGRTIWSDDDEWTEFFALNDRTLVMASRASVNWLLTEQAKVKSGPLISAVRAAESIDGYLAFKPAKFQTVIEAKYPQLTKMVPNIWATTLATAKLTCGWTVTIDVVVESEDNKHATEIAKALSQFGREAILPRVKEWIEFVEKWSQNKEQLAEIPGSGTTIEVLDAYKQYASLLNRGLTAHDERLKATVTFDAFAPITWPILSQVLPIGMPTQYSFSGSQEHSRALANAIQGYVTATGTYPPAYLATKDSKPGLSWIVALLPHLGEESKALHSQFKLDEAWDSATNRPLLERMPKVLWSANSDKIMPYRPRPRINYCIAVGPGLIFEGEKGVLAKSVTDSPADTIVFLGTETDVPWTKPDFFEVKNGQLPKSLTSESRNNLSCLMVNGIFKSVSIRDKKAFFEYLTRAGGEPTKAAADDPAKSYPQYYPAKP